jgi:hypothetical protein
VGVFFTDSLGVGWNYLGTAMPNSPVTDLVLHNPTRTLVAATYGRSMYSIDLTMNTNTENDNHPVEDFVLYQNYPNPFNPITKIKFKIPTSPLNPSPYQGEGNRERFVTLKVYDILGNEIATLVNEERTAGTYEVEFNAISHSGEVRNLPSGVYFYRLNVHPSNVQAEGYEETRKMLLLK